MILTTCKSWDDPPSKAQPKVELLTVENWNFSARLKLSPGGHEEPRANRVRGLRRRFLDVLGIVHIQLE